MVEFFFYEVSREGFFTQIGSRVSESARLNSTARYCELKELIGYRVKFGFPWANPKILIMPLFQQ